MSVREDGLLAVGDPRRSDLTLIDLAGNRSDVAGAVRGISVTQAMAGSGNPGDGVSGVVVGSNLTINPAVDLLGGKSYAVTVQAGAVVDADGIAFAGISGTAGWNFSTLAAATMSSQVFSEGGVSTGGTLVGAVNFDSTVSVGNVTFTAQSATGSSAIALSGNVVATVFNGSAVLTETGGSGLFARGVYTTTTPRTAA